MINHEYIYNLLEEARKARKKDIRKVLNKAKETRLSHRDIAVLLQAEDEGDLMEIYKIAGEIKRKIYGNRIVIFAPLYISDYCINNCIYCGYRKNNDFKRRKLSPEEIQEQVKVLEKMGHKRVALEAGEDPANCDIDYIVDAIKTIYDTYIDRGEIRRVNVNIAATTVENYRKLKEANIGTYVLFQETYHKPSYEKMHLSGPKANYEYHLTAFDRAIEGGIDDLGAGVLFGLYDYKFEVIALMLHNEYLENEYGVGFHTISVPRLKKAEGMNLDLFPHMVRDDEFKKIVAILKIAVPFTGIILSTRESPEMRKEVIEYGISQISAGSCTGVGGYKEGETRGSKSQFDVSDNRTSSQVIKELIKEGHIPSYCTACYRKGRTGDRFMELAKSGKIQDVCGPNAIMTLLEYALDYGDEEFQAIVDKTINREILKIQREDMRNIVTEKIDKIKNGERDLYL